MFRIDRKANRIEKLNDISFSELGFGEREHLQEWLENQPDVFGEELLVIQKEFSGFDDTKERLDLLALDKRGSLVVIENKLDDSGRDVVWQSLKYASYCSTLSKSSIASIYQQYLDRKGINGGQSAQDRIRDFLELEDFEEAKINVSNSQRLILVAAQFRKEVTSTVLWLLRRGIDIKCFKATPFKHGELLLLNVEQVIPLAEAEELMIGISKKETEESTTERVDARRHTLRLEFWRLMLDSLESAGVNLYSGVSPSKDHWINTGSGVSGIHYSLIFSQSEARVELVFSSSSKETNKGRFDRLYENRESFDQAFGAQLTWRRMDDKKASIVQFDKEFDGYEKENWPAMVEWLSEHIQRLVATFESTMATLRQVKAG